MLGAIVSTAAIVCSTDLQGRFSSVIGHRQLRRGSKDRDLIVIHIRSCAGEIHDRESMAVIRPVVPSTPAASMSAAAHSDTSAGR
jgi:hypothetical protein